MKGKQRKTGGAYRRMKTMMAYHAKPVKDRRRAKGKGKK